MTRLSVLLCFVALAAGAALGMPDQTELQLMQLVKYAAEDNATTQATMPCRPGSPSSCTVTEIDLVGTYSPGRLAKVIGGHDVYRSTDVNSCPDGWKIFSPHNAADWQTVTASTSIPAGPHGIFDVTRPSNGCGGCANYAMNSNVPSQRSWVTTDGSPWFLRSSPYQEPNGDYYANCYLRLLGFSSEAATFNDANCNYHSSDYLCQPSYPLVEVQKAPGTSFRVWNPITKEQLGYTNRRGSTLLDGNGYEVYYSASITALDFIFDFGQMGMIEQFSTQAWYYTSFSWSLKYSDNCQTYASHSSGRVSGCCNKQFNVNVDKFTRCLKVSFTSIGGHNGGSFGFRSQTKIMAFLPPTPSPTPSPTRSPTRNPTAYPTPSPTLSPTRRPTAYPTPSPTTSPTLHPTVYPTSSPTLGPTTSPTASPTGSPTASPTQGPTSFPTPGPTTSPTASPTGSPTASPTQGPTSSPTPGPTTSPTVSPTGSPTASPTQGPTSSPTPGPTGAPTPAPTHARCSVADGSDVSEEYPCACGSTLCEADMSGRPSFLPRPLSKVCDAERSSCDQLICEGDQGDWRTEHGDCSSYGPGGVNHGFCMDKDVTSGKEAYKVCDQCQVCYRAPSSSPTTAPTGTPTSSPTGAPTPAPTEAPWQQLEHGGSNQVTCTNFEEPAVNVSSKYECLVRARDLAHSYFQYSATSGSCETGESCEVVKATEDSEVYADPLAEFTVAGSATLQLTLPDFLSSTARESSQARVAKGAAPGELRCLEGRGVEQIVGCTATKVELDETKFVPRELLLIEGGVPIGSTRDIPSCPLGWKVFSPTTWSDWDAVKAGKVHGRQLDLQDMPVDVTTERSLPSEIPLDSASSTQWRTRDGSDWFIRSEPSFAPTGAYEPGCFIRINNAEDARNIGFAYTCTKTRSYLCQRQMVIPFGGASWFALQDATDWLKQAIMGMRGSLREEPFKLALDQIRVGGYIVPPDFRRRSAGVGVEIVYDVVVDGASEANSLDQRLTETANDPDTAQAFQEAAAKSPDMPNGTTITGAVVAEPEVKVDPPPPTPAPTPFPTESPTASPTTSPTTSPTQYPTPPPRTHSPTESPTASPTATPTKAPTPAPTAATAQKALGTGGPSGSISVGATGDPHLLNMHGQRFDLMLPGVHVLLQIPRQSRSEETLVRVEADAEADGGACADMYFKALNITGEWASAASGSQAGLQYSVAAPHKGSSTGWMAFGRVDLKVAWGHTSKGVQYLNVYARHLARAGFAVGGLLGEDDHTKESTPPAHCKSSVALAGHGNTRDGQLQGSIAEVEAM